MNEIHVILLLFLYGVAIGMLEMAFQFMQQDGQIFSFYRSWMVRTIEKSMESDSKWLKVLAYIIKPIGLCPYCNGTWIAIIFYIIQFGVSINIMPFIGIVFFTIRVLDKFNIQTMH